MPDVLYGVPAWAVKVNEVYASHDFEGAVEYNGMKLLEVDYGLSIIMLLDGSHLYISLEIRRCTRSFHC